MKKYFYCVQEQQIKDSVPTGGHIYLTEDGERRRRMKKNFSWTRQEFFTKEFFRFFSSCKIGRKGHWSAKIVSILMHNNSENQRAEKWMKYRNLTKKNISSTYAGRLHWNEPWRCRLGARWRTYESTGCTGALTWPSTAPHRKSPPVYEKMHQCNKYNLEKIINVIQNFHSSLLVYITVII